ncbi:hypothetical protein JOC94_002557 [Bacillus thermophilus]|uniref:Uncharacterized protein n=1 Tax=Siminovitchia thermophila TaxID=1245522 RepID=A0ABS2R7G5_9BACI|nr:hypothetical protein [Siminovitchia thermophila]
MLYYGMFGIAFLPPDVPSRDALSSFAGRGVMVFLLK